MQFKSLLALTALVASTSAIAVIKPSVTPLLGTYKGDCEIVVSGQKMQDTLELTLERAGDKFKISIQASMDEEAAVTVLKPGVESVEIDEELGQKTTELLSITDAELRQWVVSSRISSLHAEGFDSTSRMDLDFSTPSRVALKVKGAIGGQQTHSVSCALEKMNIRI